MIHNFYTDNELQELGFKSIGTNVKISKRASIYKPELMTIGSNVRIEDFCIVNGKVTIGNNVMICSYCLLDGHSGITLEDNVTFACKVSIHSGTDDYSGRSLFGCFAPLEFKKYKVNGSVHIKSHSLIGDSAIILPKCTLEEGTAVGAMSLITKSTEAWGIYAGVPAIRIKERSRECAKLYKELQLSSALNK